MEERFARQNADFLITATALSSVAHIVMAELLELKYEPELDKLMKATEKKIKNITIEGLTYEQQEALVRKSIKRAQHFFEFYAENLKKRHKS